jgi:DNA-binding winged helix-turn-helix (wHTH) protein
MTKALIAPVATVSASPSNDRPPPVSRSGLYFVLHAESGFDRDRLVRSVVERIESVLDRIESPERRIIDVGELRIDVDAHRVTVGGEDVHLTVLEFKLLVILALRPDRVQDRGTLLTRVWGLHVTTRTVDVHVKRLRDKMGTARRFIQSVRGVGYRFSERPTSKTQRRRRARAT